jgi:2-phosphosulfolactate phosphatase
MALAGIDQEHLARGHLAGGVAVVESQTTAGHDERHRDRVAVLGHVLPGLETQADHAHRPTVGDLLEAERTRLLRRGTRHVNIIHATGIEGARDARGAVVVIDVLRAFTVSAYALAGGARECRLVRTVAEARALAAQTDRAVICAEEEALPVEGIPISNSPTMIHATDLGGRVLIQRSTAGTQVASAAGGDDIFAASLVVARATVQACLLRRPETITLVASADHPEDHACARYMEALVEGNEPDLDALLAPLKQTERYRRAMSGEWPGFPRTDLELALTPDRFDFAMPVTRQAGYLRLVQSVPVAGR